MLKIDGVQVAERYPEYAVLWDDPEGRDFILFDCEEDAMSAADDGNGSLLRRMVYVTGWQEANGVTAKAGR